MIGACVKDQQPKEALELAELMLQRGLLYNAITYCAVTHACLECEQPERAYKSIEAMQRQGLPLGPTEYQLFISACNKGF